MVLAKTPRLALVFRMLVVGANGEVTVATAVAVAVAAAAAAAAALCQVGVGLVVCSQRG